LTAVLLSSSEALLPLGLLLILMLMRLELRFGRIIALMGRGTPFAGEPGGEVAMGCAYGSAVVTSGLVRRPVVWDRRFYVLLDSVAQMAGRRVAAKTRVGIRVVLQQQVIRVEAGQRQGRRAQVERRRDNNGNYSACEGSEKVARRLYNGLPRRQMAP